MTKDKALQAWFEGFGMTAYPNTSVPDDVALPYLTYEYVAGEFLGQDVPITVNMWFHTESEAIPNQKAEEFRKYIKANELIKCDDGYIWAMTGEPWCQSLQDDALPSVKRRYINVTLSYFTR